MNWKIETDEIARRRTLALEQGGADAVAKQHGKGKLTIRERISKLLDPSSFEEVGPTAGTGIHNKNGELIGFDPANFILGFGKIEGRRIVVGGEDFTMRGGSPSPAGLRKSVYAEKLALQHKLPLVRLHEGSGGSVSGTSGKGQSLPDPVNSPARFRSVKTGCSSTRIPRKLSLAMVTDSLYPTMCPQPWRSPVKNCLALASTLICIQVVSRS